MKATAAAVEALSGKVDTLTKEVHAIREMLATQRGERRAMVWVAGAIGALCMEFLRWLLERK